MFAPGKGLPTLNGDMEQTRVGELGGRVAAGGSSATSVRAPGCWPRASARWSIRSRSTPTSRWPATGAPSDVSADGSAVGREPVAVVGAGVKAPGGLTVDRPLGRRCAQHDRRPNSYTDARFPPRCPRTREPGRRLRPSRYLSPVERRRFDRAHQLAIGAAQDALDGCGPGLPPPDRCAVVCGVGLGAAAIQEDQYRRLFESGLKGISPLAIPILMPSAAASLLSLRFGFTGPCLTVSTACASGATAIARGR